MRTKAGVGTRPKGRAESIIVCHGSSAESANASFDPSPGVAALPGASGSPANPKASHVTPHD
jgi:hypothetical protein